MRIGITGTPGTGKTTIAKILSEEYNLYMISLTDFVKENKLWIEFDKERETYVIDEEKVYAKVIEILEQKKDNYIVEGHFLDIIPTQYFDKVFVFRTPIRTLRQRLSERNYHEKKIEENIEAEIMEVCLTDALYEYGPEKIIIVSTDKSIEETIRVIKESIKSTSG